VTIINLSLLIISNAMSNLLAPVLVAIFTFPVVGMSAIGERQATQKNLDAECEAARERKLAPERAKFIEECVQKTTKRPSCV
jgi:hypothetical protein